MIKYLSSCITFAEFPDEIALCLNITNCPCFCEHCSEPELRPDVGKEVTEHELDILIQKHPGITLIGFMGGDRSHDDIVILSNYIHFKYPKIKVGMYSGLDSLNMNLLNCLDFYKIGKWIVPEGKTEDWHKKACGPLCFPWSNQIYFVKRNNLWFNETYRFREKPLNDLNKYIIK